MAGSLNEKDLSKRDSIQTSSDDTPQESIAHKDKEESEKTAAMPEEDAAVIEKINSKVTPPPQENDEDSPFRHLPPHEAEILKRQVFVPQVKVGIKTLYRYSTTNDLIIIFISSICSIASGAALPLMTVSHLETKQQFVAF